MQDTITLEEVQASLREIIRQRMPGQPLIITDNGQPVAKLVALLGDPPTPEQREMIAKGLEATIGKWPGDETDEEIAAALKAIQRRR